MPQLPLNINMQDRKALVVGGGRVAARKVGSLLAAGAVVQVVAAEVLQTIVELNTAGSVALRLGAYQPDDLEGVFLAVAATDNAGVNARVAGDARARGILVSVADAPDLGNCTFPALLRRGDLEITVSTGGGCPSFAVHVRDLVAQVITAEYGHALERLAAGREKLLTQGNSSTYNARLIRKAVQAEIALLDDHKGKP